MVLDISLLNTQHFKVRIKGKVEQYKERNVTLLIGVVAVEKGAFGSSSTTLANLLLTFLQLLYDIKYSEIIHCLFYKIWWFKGSITIQL